MELSLLKIFDEKCNYIYIAYAYIYLHALYYLHTVITSHSLNQLTYNYTNKTVSCDYDYIHFSLVLECPIRFICCNLAPQ